VTRAVAGVVWGGHTEPERRELIETPNEARIAMPPTSDA
jgi:hypothetical protein